MTNFVNTEIGNIPSFWKIRNLGNVSNITKLAGYEYTSHFKYVEDGEVIALRALNVREGVLDLTQVKKIYRNVSNSLMRSKLYKDDILFTYVGANIGQFALVPESEKFHLAPNICRIRVSESLLPYFLFSYFRTSFFRENLSNYSVGSSQPTLPMGNIRKILIPLPPLCEQESIAEVLSSLDDKIELLHRNNKTLEQLAETLFRQWFIEEAEESWEEKQLDEIAEYLNGLALQKYPGVRGQPTLPAIKIREMNQGITESTDEVSSLIPDKYIVENGDILFSWSGSLDIIVWTGGRGALNQHLFKVSSTVYPKWLIYFATRLFLPEFREIAANKATTMGHIQRSHLSQAKIKLPDQERIDECNETISSVFSKLIKNSLQIQQLENLRDALLPKLMSGAVKIIN